MNACGICTCEHPMSDCDHCRGSCKCPPRKVCVVHPSPQVKAILRLVNARIRDLERQRVRVFAKPDKAAHLVTAIDEVLYLRELIKRELEKKDA